MALIDKLTAIGDAIRNKTGKTELLTLDEMAEEIEGIEGGISIDDVVQKKLTSVKINAKDIGAFTFYFYTGLQRVDASSCKTAGEGAFRYCANLEVVNMPQLENITGLYCFAGCNALETISLPKLWRMNDSTFYDCKSLKYVNVPLITYVGASGFAGTDIESISLPSVETVYTYAFDNCKNLKIIDFGLSPDFARSGSFYRCSNLTTIVIRGNTVSTLSHVNNFDGTPFAVGGTGGTVYVPATLVEAYKTATNWSVLYGANTCDFVAIEGSEYE